MSDGKKPNARRADLYREKIEKKPAGRNRRIDLQESLSATRRSRAPRHVSGERDAKTPAAGAGRRLPARSSGPDAKERQKHTAKRRRRVFPVLFGILAVLVFLGIVGFLGYKFVRTDEIDVVGNAAVGDDYIISLSGIETGMHVFNIDKARAKEGIESDPFLVYKGIRYTFPNKITIVVEERQAAACFDFFNTYVIIDADGLILGHEETGEQPDLPLVGGIDVLEFALGAKIRTDDTAKQLSLTELLDAIGAYALTGQIEKIDFSEQDEVFLYLDNGMDVRLGRAAQFDEKMEWLSNILPTLAEQGLSGGTIDITSVQAPSYVPPETEEQE